jgi:hypothetical protein
MGPNSRRVSDFLLRTASLETAEKGSATLSQMELMMNRGVSTSAGQCRESRFGVSAPPVRRSCRAGRGRPFRAVAGVADVPQSISLDVHMRVLFPALRNQGCRVWGRSSLGSPGVVKCSATLSGVQWFSVMPARAGSEPCFPDSRQEHAGVASRGYDHFILWSRTKCVACFLWFKRDG